MAVGASCGIDTTGGGAAPLGAAWPVATLRSGCGVARASAAARAARPRSPAEGKRSSGSFAIARRTTSSNCSGRSGRTELTGGGGSPMCAHIFAGSSSRGYGTCPVSASKSTHPSEYTSARASTPFPASCSGAM